MKKFTLKCEARFTPNNMAFEMEIETPDDYARNGPPLLMIDQEGNFYVLRGQILNGRPDDFGYQLIMASDAVRLNNKFMSGGRIVPR